MIALSVLSYIILGGKVVWEALRNISKGQIFDENFLMSIATIGAFIIAEYLEAVGVMLFYRIGELFEHKAVERSRGQIMDAVDMRPETVNRMQQGSIEVIPAEDAEIGDVLLIRPGDRIPLDGMIVEGESRIDTSPITGEPGSCQRKNRRFHHIRLRQYLRPAENPGRKTAVGIHGFQDIRFSGKRSCQQT